MNITDKRATKVLVTEVEQATINASHISDITPASQEEHAVSKEITPTTSSTPISQMYPGVHLTKLR